MLYRIAPSRILLDFANIEDIFIDEGDQNIPFIGQKNHTKMYNFANKFTHRTNYEHWNWDALRHIWQHKNTNLR